MNNGGQLKQTKKYFFLKADRLDSLFLNDFYVFTFSAIITDFSSDGIKTAL